MRAARITHAVAATAYLGLIALLLAWLLWIAPPPGAVMSVAALILLLPLALPLRGVLGARRYTMAWSTMLILAYFTHGVSSAAAPPPERWLGLIEVGLTLTYFTAAILYVRLSRPAARADVGG